MVCDKMGSVEERRCVVRDEGRVSREGNMTGLGLGSVMMIGEREGEYM